MKRCDGHEKVTGKAIYADDMKLDQMLYAKQLYSEHPHAKIIQIDTTEALKIPGVFSIITAKDAMGTNIVGEVIRDHRILADDKVRYHGDVVAVVAAKNYTIACKAVDAIQTTYETLPAVLNPVDALKPDAPLIHEDRKDNVTATSKVRSGNPDKIFEEAKHVFDADFQTQFIEHAYLEPESCVAIKNPNNTITIYGGMQHPFSTRRYVACFLGLTLNKVRVIQTTLGGGFGGRDDTISALCARTALLAWRTEKPVKLTLTREESIRESYKRHPFTIKLKMAVNDEKKITAFKSSFVIDGGPYCSVSPYVVWRPTVQCTGPYKIPHVHCDGMAVYTNNTFSGAMRGFGTPQYNFATESFMDMVAHERGIDPITFRQKNLFLQNDKTHTGQTLAGHQVSIGAVVQKTLKEFDWDNKYKKISKGQPNSDNKLYGVGLACSYRGVSLGAEGADFCSAIVNIQEDGSVLLETGVSENGQGSKTAMIRILSIELGINPDSIIFMDTDTSSVPDGKSTVASRGTLAGGNAVIDAARQIKNTLLPVLEKKLGKSKQGYIFAKDKIINPRTKKELLFSQAAALCYKNRIYPYAFGTWQGPKVNWDEEKGQGDPYFTYVYGCQACDVEVNAKTGKVKVLSVVATHDVGRAINPEMLKGQIYGGIVMGIGQALSEEIVHKDGKIQNLNFNSYKIPRSLDTPDMKVFLVENPDPSGPFGAKSIGEPTNELMAGTIGNAVFNAVGVRVTQLPITPEKIFASLNDPRLR
ncbi:xanthine dehydrogenase family protein molybdopterin-binding subunit [bacterium]|nr:xanthine dehydrogenase family protein molybdopterin-binding subunit [bacterium]